MWLNHSHEDGYYQKQKRTSVNKDVEKLELLHANGGNTKWYSRCGNSMAVLPKIKNRITLCSNNSFSEYILERIESRVSDRYLYHYAAASTIAKK